jgi:hypothetical protein
LRLKAEWEYPFLGKKQEGVQEEIKAAQVTPQPSTTQVCLGPGMPKRYPLLRYYLHPLGIAEHKTTRFPSPCRWCLHDLYSLSFLSNLLTIVLGKRFLYRATFLITFDRAPDQVDISSAIILKSKKNAMASKTISALFKGDKGTCLATRPVTRSR